METISERRKLNNEKEVPLKSGAEISIMENPKLEKLRKAPEEVVAKAIREMLRKDG